MRLALTAGGTGGHIYPALAVLQAVRERLGAGNVDVTFFGPDDRGERQVLERNGIWFERVPSAPVRGRGPLQLGRSGSRLVLGMLTAIRKLRRFNPDVIFSTGGYGSFPASVGARFLRRPLVVYLPDVSPGWAVRAETKLATVMATTSEAALAFLPREKTRVTGYPVRSTFFIQKREDVRKRLGLTESASMLLIAGASQGAHAINQAVFKGLRSLVNVAEVYHITGKDDHDDAAGFQTLLGETLARRYHPAPFREDLPELMLAADLAIMRAGASVLGELPAASLPAILVPGTFAGGHQRDNARWLADAGATVVLEEGDIAGMSELALRLLEDDDRLAQMRQAAAKLAKPNAAADIAAILEEVARR